MRKYSKNLLCSLLCLAFALFTGCAGGSGSGPQGGGASAHLSIVTTIFPVYDWTRQILGGRADSVNLSFLLDSGVDLHSYQPTVDDMVKISSCGLFICVGGASDGWAEDASAENTTVINLLEALGIAAKEEETVEGMQEGGHEDGHSEDNEPGGETEYDEHIWLSLKNAQTLCAVIADALCTLDPDGAETYRENLRGYTARLADLDAQYARVVQGSAVRTLLFADRFPFRYLADDYGLDYYAAFPGCSAESEASFETVVFLAEKVDTLHLPAVLTIENSDGKIARTVVENTAGKTAQILRLDSMQSTTAQDAAGGAAYLDAMEHNLDVLREALR